MLNTFFSFLLGVTLTLTTLTIWQIATNDAPVDVKGAVEQLVEKVQE